MKTKKKLMACVLSFALLFGMIPATEVSAIKSVRLSARKLTVTKGKSKTLKVLNTTKKVTWKIVSGKKYITLKKKGKVAVTIKGRNKGKAKVQAKIGKKKLTCTVTVKNAKKPTKPQKDDSCTLCKGSKKCYQCHGTGRIKVTGGTYAICVSCNGTGVCKYCTNSPSDDSPSNDTPSDDSPSDEAKPSSEFSVKASDGTTITAKRGKTALHSCQSYPGEYRSNIKVTLPNFESYTGGEFTAHSKEKYQNEWSDGYLYEYYDDYVPVPCYRSDYIMRFGSGAAWDWMDKYIAMLDELGFKVVETEEGPLSTEYYLRYKGTESITKDICCRYSRWSGNLIYYDMYISRVEGLSNDSTMVSFEYPVEVGFEMDSVKAMTQDTSVTSTYYPASNRTFWASGGNMIFGESVRIEVNQSKLKKGAVFTLSDLAKESEKENGKCKLFLKNTYRLGKDRTDLYPSSDNVKDAEIKVLAADSKNVAFYFKLKFIGDASHTYLFEGIASGVPEDVSPGTVTVPSTGTLSGVCSKCYGRKLCPVCHGHKGMSYNTWGQGGSGWVKCAGCDGSGNCWVCDGSGK